MGEQAKIFWSNSIIGCGGKKERTARNTPRDRWVAESIQESQTRMLRTGGVPLATRAWRVLVTFLATGAFAGYAPLAPGTVGSVVGLLVVKFVTAPAWRYRPIASLMLFAVVFIFACLVAHWAERIFAERDSSAIVLDEILGMMATMFCNPTGWTWLLTGFTLFRLFDIIKPWPASWFDRIEGGAGVMLDDLAAACYANIILQVIRRIV
jgi:phosphatidylglycerophosphatase A